MRRYTRAPLISGGMAFGTSYAIPSLRANIENGNIRVLARVVTQEKQRLDTIAQDYYGDGRNWWILAAASGIGWAFVPCGTVVVVPDLSDVAKYV